MICGLLQLPRDGVLRLVALNHAAAVLLLRVHHLLGVVVVVVVWLVLLVERMLLIHVLIRAILLQNALFLRPRHCLFGLGGRNEVRAAAFAGR